MSAASIYVVTHTPSLRHYVGKTKQKPQRRWARHAYLAKTSPLGRLHRAIAEHGIEEFVFNVIEEHASEDDAFEAERFWIAFFRSNVDGYGFNLNSGGEGGRTHSAEARASMALLKVGNRLSLEHRRRIGVASASRERAPHSDETRRKIGDANRGKVRDATFRQRVADVHRGRAKSASAVEKVAAAHRGSKRSPETCARISDAKRANMTDEKRALMAQRRREWWARRRAAGLPPPPANGPAAIKARRVAAMHAWLDVDEQ